MADDQVQHERSREMPPLYHRLFSALLLFVQGVANGLALHRVARALWADSALRVLVAKCFLLNGGLFLGSMFVFDYVVGPALGRLVGPDTWLPLAFAYKAMWLYPVYIICFAASSSWHAQIADRAFTHTYGPSKSSVSVGSVADAVYKILLYCAVVVETFALELIPYVGSWLSFALMAWTYALLCIDAKWMLKTSWRFPKRLEMFQRRWAFFLGFGTPFTLTCYFFPLLVNCGVYAILFPIFEILAVSTDEKFRETPPIGPLRSKSDPTIGSLGMFRSAELLVDVVKRLIVVLLAPRQRQGHKEAD